jgi:CheY-specific phosphatase CheX
VADVERILTDAAVGTLADMCFATPEGFSFDDALTGGLRGASIRASDRLRSLSVLASRAAIDHLVTNMLDLEEPPTDAQRDDALRELANVVAGRVVVALSGQAALDRVSLPTSLDDDAVASARAGAHVRVAMDIEGGLVVVLAELADDAP